VIQIPQATRKERALGITLYTCPLFRFALAFAVLDFDGHRSHLLSALINTRGEVLFRKIEFYDLSSCQWLGLHVFPEGSITHRRLAWLPVGNVYGFQVEA